MPIIKATVKLIENYRSIADNSRHHDIVFDLPTISGGSDIGPTALEVAIMSLAGCAMTIFIDIAKNSGVKIDEMDIVAEADEPEDSPTLKGVKLKINIHGKAREQKIKALWRRTEANCPVVKIFTEKIPVKFELNTNI